MPVYFDTSALVPLVIDEPTTRHCVQVWDDADAIITSSIAYVEVHAALAQAARNGRISATEHLRSLDAFELRWNDIFRVPASEALISMAAVLAAAHALRGYDAVHCATALAAASDDFFALSGDRDLLHAWSELGIPTVDTAA